MQVQSLRVKLIIVPLRVVTGGWCVGVKRPDQKDLNDEWDSFEFFVEQVSHAEMDFWKWKATRSNATLSVWMIRAKIPIQFWLSFYVKDGLTTLVEP